MTKYKMAGISVKRHFWEILIHNFIFILTLKTHFKSLCTYFGNILLSIINNIKHTFIRNIKSDLILFDK